MLRSAAQVCVHCCPGLLRGLGSVLFDPMLLFAQGLLYENPLDDQHIAVAVFKGPRLLEGGFPLGMGEAGSCTKPWATSGCLWTSLITTAPAAHWPSSPLENSFLTEGLGTGGKVQGCVFMGSVLMGHTSLSLCP